MKEKNELLLHVYKDCDMSVTTLTELLDDLKEKDNKIKGGVEDLLKEYQSFLNRSKECLEKENVPLETEGVMTKMMANMGVSKEVKHDNSDSSIADLLIKGISMGSIDMEKKLEDYKKEVEKGDLKVAKEFLKFQQKAIDKLKKFL